MKTTNSQLPTAAETLVKSGIAAKQISAVTGRHVTTAYDYINGDSRPEWDEIIAMIAKADLEQARVIYQALSCGRFTVVDAEPPTVKEMDLDRDGDVDCDDVNLSLIGITAESPAGMAVLAGAPRLTSDRKGKCETVFGHIARLLWIGHGQIQHQSRAV
jgi:hypothetical protein